MKTFIIKLLAGYSVLQEIWERIKMNRRRRRVLVPVKNEELFDHLFVK